MEKNDILTELATICDNVEKLSCKPTNTKITIDLNEENFIKTYNMFSDKKVTKNDTRFSIYMDNVEIEIIRT